MSTLAILVVSIFAIAYRTEVNIAYISNYFLCEHFQLFS